MVRRVRRSRARRAAETAFGLLLVMKAVVAGALVVALLAAGVWVSWGGVREAMGSGGVRGSMAVRSCGTSWCSGSFTPAGGGAVRAVRVDRLVTTGPGARFGALARPGSSVVVRTGVAGELFALRSVAGALLLSALALWVGLGLRRWAWASAALGVLVIAVPFALG